MPSMADYLNNLVSSAHVHGMTPREYILLRQEDSRFKKSLEMNSPLLMWDKDRWLDLPPGKDFRA